MIRVVASDSLKKKAPVRGPAGVPGEIRTPDLQITNLVLSRLIRAPLSYQQTP